ncbi:DUF2953 domain-containing protein [Clostridium sp. ATCC 25772]|uniref:DUF2953 domain-containing protein n=1 Tax=Clostridium sp. ATCC 25772 TaxID=1676991 RepID=UPI000785B88D|nr:DUF2953 domain-containing protein [Clostridium sp. ATCC 25772]
MNYFLFILTIILAILFCPIPLKLKLKYINKKLEIFIYKKNLNLDKKTKSNKINIEKKEEPSKEGGIKRKFSKDKLSSIDIKSLLNDLIYNKFKVKMKIKSKVDYSLSDAAHTAIVYGYAHQGFVLLQLILKLFFKVNDFKYDLDFEFNKSYINVETECIFFISLAKIIYVCFLVFKNIKRKDKVKISQPV